MAWNIQRFPERARNVSTEKMEQVLNNTPEIVKSGSDSLVEYGQVRAAMIDWAWNAPPPPAVAEGRREEAPVQQAALTVDKLVKVLGYSVDVAEPANSKAILKYLPESKVRPPAREAGAQLKEGTLKLAGQRLDGPIDHIRIVSITSEGVEFGFDEDGAGDGDPAAGRLRPVAAPGLRGPLRAGRAGRRDPDPQARVHHAHGDHPDRPEQVPHRHRRRAADRRRLPAHPLGRGAARAATATRPPAATTASSSSRSAPGSIAERHGAQTGDVIKSINGHPVTSQAEAINFVKTNAEMYDKWEVVVANLGQERTVTYYPPEK